MMEVMNAAMICKLYFSKLFLNPEDLYVQRDVKDNYEMHRTLERVFGKNKDERLLWRFEKNDGKYVLYCQSRTKPNWNKLTNAFRYYMLREPIVVEFTPPTNGSWRYRILANAAVNTPEGRKGLLAQNEQEAWFKEMATRNGFALQSLNSFGYLKKFKRSQITAAATKLEGVLTINDGMKFTEFVQNGIGKCKAFGFGLVTLAKIS